MTLTEEVLAPIRDQLLRQIHRYHDATLRREAENFASLSSSGRFGRKLFRKVAMLLAGALVKEQTASPVILESLIEHSMVVHDRFAQCDAPLDGVLSIRIPLASCCQIQNMVSIDGCTLDLDASGLRIGAYDHQIYLRNLAYPDGRTEWYGSELIEASLMTARCSNIMGVCVPCSGGPHLIKQEATRRHSAITGPLPCSVRQQVWSEQRW